MPTTQPSPRTQDQSTHAKPREVLVVTHSRVASGSNLVRETIEELRHRGFAVSVIDNLEAKPFGTPTVSVDENTEVVLVLGGDGTILRAAELVKATPVPIMGINLGHIGFLAEFESFQIADAIRRVAEHDYVIEERAIADVKVWLPGAKEPIREWALNDVTVEKADRGKMVELGIKVDDVEMSSYGCDGVIVSTSTGSTAYAFSAGGPIMWPNVQALQLVPLAAHALFSRPVIIGTDSKFTIDVLNGSSCPGWISCDGRRSRELPRGTSIVVSKCHDTLRLARLGEAPFTQRLVTKFDLPVVGWREHNRTLLAGNGGEPRHATSYTDVDEQYKRTRDAVAPDGETGVTDPNSPAGANGGAHA